MAQAERTTGRVRRTAIAAGAVTALAVGVLGVVATPAGADDPPVVTTHVIPSFDGTPILATLFVPAGVTGADPAPLVLQTHGCPGARRCRRVRAGPARHRR